MCAASLIPSSVKTISVESKDLDLTPRIMGQEIIEDRNYEIEELQKLISDLDDRLNEERKEIKSLILALHQRESSLSWRFSQYYGRYFNMDSKLTVLISIALKSLLGNKTSDRSDNLSIFFSLNDFLACNYKNGSVIVFSRDKFKDNEEERSTCIAQAFSKMGYAVIYVSGTDSEQEYFEFGEICQNIFQIPIDLLIEHRDKILSSSFIGQKIFITDYPHPALFKILSYANSKNWFTIYDVGNNWKTLHEAGQAIWYDKDMEEYVLLNSDLITTSNSFLSEKVGKKLEVNPPRTIPNAISRDEMILGFIEEISRFDHDYSIKRR